LGRDLVREFLERGTVAALTQVNPTIEFRQIRKRRVLPDRERGLQSTAARQHHDAQPSENRRLQAGDAARRKHEVALAPHAMKSIHRGVAAGTILAEGY